MFAENLKTNIYNNQKLPLIIKPAKEVKSGFKTETRNSLINENLQFLKENLLKYGALLFRGFSIESPEIFKEFVQSFSNHSLMNYSGGASPRIQIKSNVYTSTEYPQDLTLALHNELSYTNNYPTHLYFCCLVAPSEGGETSLGDSRSILKNIDSEVVNLFKQKNVKYFRNLDGCKGSGYSWQDAFETEDKNFIEKHCRDRGADFCWKSNGKLRISQICPSTAIHPETNEEVWFNQAVGFHPSEGLDEKTYRKMIKTDEEDDFRLNACFGDDTPFDLSALEQIREVLRKETVLFQWQTGDVLVIDNLLAAHGRMPFSGSRKIILAMT